jgi:competence CoiA-like predicted nuclease
MELNYALLNKRLVHVDQVKNGLECDCICPQCGEPLIAKNQGDIKIHHFAHQSESECLHAYESMLHLLAKEVIDKYKQILLPSLYARVDNRELDILINDQVLLQGDSVVLEKKLSNIVPDVIFYYDSNPLLIEIKVTHGIDQEKEEKIKTLGIDSIEIDLSGFKYIDERIMVDVITNRTDCKKWIYNKKQSLVENKLIEFSEDKETVHHGLALHVLDCPKDMRHYKGKSYANVIDDCSYCPYNISSHQSTDYIRCIGKTDIDSIDKINKIKCVEKENGLITSIK